MAVAVDDVDLILQLKKDPSEAVLPFFEGLVRGVERPSSMETKIDEAMLVSCSNRLRLIDCFRGLLTTFQVPWTRKWKLGRDLRYLLFMRKQRNRWQSYSSKQTSQLRYISRQISLSQTRALSKKSLLTHNPQFSRRFSHTIHNSLVTRRGLTLKIRTAMCVLARS